MGKNDLWIAATASVLNIPLITTDNDFIHLDKTFLTLIKV
jgi:tRNA(fMet)-specific endonuclease VapC